MNAFERLVEKVRLAYAAQPKFDIRIDRPKSADGLWFLSVIREDDFVVEIEWNRHRGFGIVAGRDLTFGGGIDEIYASAEAAFDRVAELLLSGEPTSSANPVELGELRRLRGFLQKDVAACLGITKSGVAQMERGESLGSMQIETLQRLVASLGGELVISARFPEGIERRIAME